MFSFKLLSVLLICISVSLAADVSCYQSIQNTSEPVTGEPSSCPISSMSCLKVYDNATDTFIRACHAGYCFYEKDKYSTRDFCQDKPVAPFFMIYCCCYDSGCNGSQSYSSLIRHIGWTIIPLLTTFFI